MNEVDLWQELKTLLLENISYNMINILRVYAGIAQLTHSVNIK